MTMTALKMTGTACDRYPIDDGIRTGPRNGSASAVHALVSWNLLTALNGGANILNDADWMKKRPKRRLVNLTMSELIPT